MSNFNSGDTIRDFEIRSQIGKGNFGVVYRAHDKSLQRDVALKVIRQSTTKVSEFIQSFDNEAQVVAKFQHPHIVQLHDFWREDNNAYLVMPWVDGMNLDELIKTHRKNNTVLPLDQTLRIMLQITQALDYSHSKNVIHRDIKPDNILIATQLGHQVAYLTDFGIAKRIAESAAEDLPQDDPDEESRMYGSIGYAAPEQMQNQPVTPQSDIYSLGIILYELLTGAHPFEKAHYNSYQMIQCHLHELVPPIEGDLAAMNSIIQTATAKDPSDRYETPTAMMEAILSQLRFEQRQDRDILLQFQVEAKNLHLLVNPYKGLEAFGEGDADDFFGRDKLIGQLVEHFKKQNFLAVIGPSGNGKSSLVRAGLIPSIKAGELEGSQNWYRVDLTPGEKPLDNLARALETVCDDSASAILNRFRDVMGLSNLLKEALIPLDDSDEQPILFLLIDQFEELFTLCKDEDEQKKFLDLIYNAASDRSVPVRIAITLRADFNDMVLRYSNFGGLVRDNNILIAPPDVEEIGEAIVKPAANLGVTVDDRLVLKMIDDIKDQPGIFPLLQHALREMFDKVIASNSNTMTFQMYNEIGGVVGAITQRADKIYDDFEDDILRSLTRDVFLRLINPEGTSYTRKRVPLQKLFFNDEHGISYETQIRHILELYQQHRLITFDRDPQTRKAVVEIAHEALLSKWDRLAQWIADYNQDLQMYDELNKRSTQWYKENQEDSYLLHGKQIQKFEDWLDKDFADRFRISDEAQHYLTMSVLEHEKNRARIWEDEQDRQQKNKAITILLIVLSVALIFTVVTLFYAFTSRQEVINVNNQLGEAIATSEYNAQMAEEAAIAAEIRANALQSLALITRAQTAMSYDRQLALRLTMLANGLANTPPQAITALLELSHASNPVRVIGEHDSEIMAVDLTQEGDRALSGDIDGNVFLWDVTNNEKLLTLTGHTEPILDVAFVANSNRAISLSEDGLTLVWDLETGEIAQSLEGNSHTISALIVCPCGEHMATGDIDGHIQIWDLRDFSIIGTLEGHTDEISDLDFSPNSDFLISGSADTNVIYWDLATNEPLAVLEDSRARVTSVAFVNENRVVVGTGNGKTLLWYPKRNQFEAITKVHARAVYDMVTLANNGYLSVSGQIPTETEQGRGEMIMWNRDGTPEQILHAHSRPIRSIAVDSLGEHAITGSNDGQLILWDLTNTADFDWTIPTQHLGAVALAMGNNSPIMAISEGFIVNKTGLSEVQDSDILLWNLNTQSQLQAIAGHEAQVRTMAFSPDDRFLAAGDDSGNIILWDMVSGDIRNRWSFAPDADIWKVAFTPDGLQIVAIANDSQQVKQWDINNGELIFESNTLGSGAVDMLPDPQNPNHLLILCASSNIWSYSMATGELAPVMTNDQLVNNTSLTLNTDGSTFIVSNRDGNLFWIARESGDIINQATNEDETYWRSDTHPNGTFFATSSTNGIVLWDSETGESLYQFDPDGPTWDVRFSQDGHYLYAAALDGQVRIYPTDSQLLLDWTEANRYVRNLTCDEVAQFGLPADTPCTTN